MIQRPIVVTAKTTTFGEWRCPIDGRTFTRILALVEHMDVAHDRDPMELRFEVRL